MTWRPEMTTTVASEGEEGEAKQVLVSRVTFLDSATLSDDAAAAVAEVSQSANGSLRIKLHDKPAALEKLGRTFGMFKDRIEHIGKDGEPGACGCWDAPSGGRQSYVLVGPRVLSTLSTFRKVDRVSRLPLADRRGELGGVTCCR